MQKFDEITKKWGIYCFVNKTRGLGHLKILLICSLKYVVPVSHMQDMFNNIYVWYLFHIDIKSIFVNPNHLSFVLYVTVQDKDENSELNK